MALRVLGNGADTSGEIKFHSRSAPPHDQHKCFCQFAPFIYDHFLEVRHKKVALTSCPAIYQTGLMGTSLGLQRTTAYCVYLGSFPRGFVTKKSHLTSCPAIYQTALMGISLGLQSTTATSANELRPFDSGGDASTDLQRTVHFVRAELQGLKARSAEISQRLRKVRQIVIGLAEIVNVDDLDEEMKSLLFDNRSDRRAPIPGLTHLCRWLMKGRPAHAFTIEEFFQYVRQNHPALLAHHKQPKATIKTMLTRLVAYGEIVEVSVQNDRRRWKVAPGSTGPSRDIRTRRAIAALRQFMFESTLDEDPELSASSNALAARTSEQKRSTANLYANSSKWHTRRRRRENPELKRACRIALLEASGLLSVNDVYERILRRGSFMFANPEFEKSKIVGELTALVEEGSARLFRVGFDCRWQRIQPPEETGKPT